jgi:hypothetical protein
MSRKSEEYRIKALEYIALAKGEPNQQLRDRLLSVARSFQQLAEQLDRLDDLSARGNGRGGRG